MTLDMFSAPVQRLHSYFLDSLACLKITAVAGRGILFIALRWLKIGEAIGTCLAVHLYIAQFIADMDSTAGARK